MRSKVRFFSLALLSALFLFSACFERNTMEKASALNKEGKYDEAIKMYQEIIKKKPAEIAAFKAIADIKLTKKDFPGAIEGYKKLIELDKNKGVTELVSMLSYNKNVSDKAADAIKSLSNGRNEAINEVLRQIDAGNNYVKIDYLNALARIGSPASFAAERISKYLDDDYFGIRKAALEVLGTLNAQNLKEAGAIDKMVKCINDDNATVAETAVKSLGMLKNGANEIVPSLIELLTKQNEMKELAKKALADIGPAAKSAVPALIALTDEKKPETIRIAAIDALTAMGSNANDAVPTLIPLLQDKDHIIKTASANALTKIGKPSVEAVPELINLLKNKDVNVKLRAIVELSDMGKAAAPALPQLEQLMKDPNKEVSEEAKRSYDKVFKAKR